MVRAYRLTEARRLARPRAERGILEVSRPRRPVRCSHMPRANLVTPAARGLAVTLSTILAAAVAFGACRRAAITERAPRPRPSPNAPPRRKTTHLLALAKLARGDDPGCVCFARSPRHSAVACYLYNIVAGQAELCDASIAILGLRSTVREFVLFEGREDGPALFDLPTANEIDATQLRAARQYLARNRFEPLSGGRVLVPGAKSIISGVQFERVVNRIGERDPTSPTGDWARFDDKLFVRCGHARKPVSLDHEHEAARAQVTVYALPTGRILVTSSTRWTIEGESGRFTRALVTSRRQLCR